MNLLILSSDILVSIVAIFSKIRLYICDILSCTLAQRVYIQE